MKEKAKPKTLENLTELDKMFESVPVTIKPLTFPPVIFSKKAIAEYNPTDFSLTLSGEETPSIFIDYKIKTAKAYPSRYLQQRFSSYEREKAKRLMGIYHEELNTLRRHDYTIAYNEILWTAGPADYYITWKDQSKVFNRFLYPYF